MSGKYNETCLKRPPNGILLCLLELIYVAKGHLDELQMAEIVSKSKSVPSVFIKTHYWSQVINLIIEVVVTNRFHCIKSRTKCDFLSVFTKVTVMKSFRIFRDIFP